MTVDQGSTAAAWLQSQARHYRRSLTLLTGLGVARFAASVAGFYVLASVLAAAVVERQAPGGVMLVGLTVAFVIQLALQWRIDNDKQQLSERLLAHYQQQLTDLLERRSLALVRDFSPAQWQSVYSRRLPALPAYLVDYLSQQQIATLVPVLVLVVVFPVSWLAGLLLAVSAPLIPLFMWLVGKGAAAAQQRQFVALERLSSIFLDRLRARQLLHVHTAVAGQQAVFERAGRSLKTRTLAVLRLAFLSSAVLDFFATLGMALVAVFVGFSLLGEIRFGSWQSGLDLRQGLFLLLLAPSFFAELKTLGRYYHLRAEAIGAAEEVYGLLDETGEAPVVPGRLPLTLTDLPLRGSDGQLLFHLTRLTVRPGDKILLQGDSGAGKTTLLEALLGLRPTQARLAVTLPRQDVAWLSQTPAVFSGSVRDNLTLGQPATDPELLGLLERVELSAWLRDHAAGLDTQLGDYPPLSGGQLHRLALARVLFFDQPLVVLDEPTANLDRQQAARITRLLQTTLVDKTVIWVAHDTEFEPFFNQHWQIDRSTASLRCHGQTESMCA